MINCPGCNKREHWFKRDLQVCINAAALFHGTFCTPGTHNPDCPVSKMEQYLKERPGHGTVGSNS